MLRAGSGEPLMVSLLVDTDAFLEAGDHARSAAESVGRALSGAVSGLSGSSHMAGSDQNGLTWAHSYDTACASLIGYVAQLQDAAGVLGRKLSATGYYYELTELANAGLTDAAVVLPPPVSPTPSPHLPSAAGGARKFPNADDPAFEWVAEQIANFIGNMWPDGDTDKLDAASAVWHRLAGDLDDAASGLSAASDALKAVDTPELATIHAEVGRVQSAARKIATACRSVGTACNDLSGQINHVHLQTGITLGITVAAIVATVAVGAGLTPVTFGISDAAAAGGVAAEVGGAVATITGFIAELASTVSAGVGLIVESAAGIVGVSTELAASIGVAVGDVSASAALWGAAGAVENVGITAITQPGDDLVDAAGEGFVGGAIGGALGQGIAGVWGSATGVLEDAGSSLSSKEFLEKWSDGVGDHGPNWIWPSGRGFDGIPEPNSLEIGQRIDRITATTPDGRIVDGGFASPKGQPFPTRSLPPDRLEPPFVTISYQVVKPLPEEVLEGRVASWFDEPGGGIQYEFPGGIQKYVDEGYLRIIKVRAQ
jgi:hypothetical protein